MGLWEKRKQQVVVPQFVERNTIGSNRTDHVGHCVSCE